MQGMKTVGVTDYTNQARSKHFGRKNVSVQHPQNIHEMCTNIRGAHLQCMNNYYKKLEYKQRNENFWSYRLHKLGNQKCCGLTNGVDQLLDMRFAKATQVKTGSFIESIYENRWKVQKLSALLAPLFRSLTKPLSSCLLIK